MSVIIVVNVDGRRYECDEDQMEEIVEEVLREYVGRGRNPASLVARYVAPAFKKRVDLRKHGILEKSTPTSAEET